MSDGTLDTLDKGLETLKKPKPRLEGTGKRTVYVGEYWKGPKNILDLFL